MKLDRNLILDQEHIEHVYYYIQEDAINPEDAAKTLAIIQPFTPQYSRRLQAMHWGTVIATAPNQAKQTLEFLLDHLYVGNHNNFLLELINSKNKSSPEGMDAIFDNCKQRGQLLYQNALGKYLDLLSLDLLVNERQNPKLSETLDYILSKHSPNDIVHATNQGNLKAELIVLSDMRGRGTQAHTIGIELLHKLMDAGLDLESPREGRVSALAYVCDMHHRKGRKSDYELEIQTLITLGAQWERVSDMSIAPEARQIIDDHPAVRAKKLQIISNQTRTTLGNWDEARTHTTPVSPKI